MHAEAHTVQFTNLRCIVKWAEVWVAADVAQLGQHCAAAKAPSGPLLPNLRGGGDAAAWLPGP